MSKIKLRITALEKNMRKFAVMFMGVKVAVAFGRDSGAKVGYDVRMLSGDIRSGGSRINWVCIVDEGSIFELEVDNELYTKNKNRIKKWKMEEIEEYSLSKERSQEIRYIEDNLE